MPTNKEQIVFVNSGLNSDDDLRFFKGGDSRDRLNCLNSENGRLGVITNLKGNELFLDTNTGAIVRMIDYNENNEIVYFWINGSNTGINAVNKTTKSVRQIVSGVNLFVDNIDARIIGNILIYTDNENEPQRVDLNSQLLNTTIDKTSLNRPIDVFDINTYLRVNNTNQSNNLLSRNAYYQFCVRLVYNTNEVTQLSYYSPVVYFGGTDALNFDVLLDFSIDIFNNEGYGVKEIEIFSRSNLSNNFILSKVIEPFNTGELNTDSSISFSDSGQRRKFTYIYSGQSLSEVIADDVLFYNIPIKSKNVEIAENRAVFGNNSFGYDIPNNTSSSNSIAVRPIESSGQYSGLVSFTGEDDTSEETIIRLSTFRDNLMNPWAFNIGGYIYYYNDFFISGLTNIDRIIVRTESFGAIIPNPNNVDPSTLTGIEDAINNQLIIEYFNDGGEIDKPSNVSVDTSDNRELVITIPTGSEISSSTIQNRYTQGDHSNLYFKDGSAYNYFVNFYDRYGRTTGAIELGTIDIPYIANNNSIEYTRINTPTERIENAEFVRSSDSNRTPSQLDVDTNKQIGSYVLTGELSGFFYIKIPAGVSPTAISVTIDDDDADIDEILYPISRFNLVGSTSSGSWYIYAGVDGIVTTITIRANDIYRLYQTPATFSIDRNRDYFRILRESATDSFSLEIDSNFGVPEWAHSLSFSVSESLTYTNVYYADALSFNERNHAMRIIHELAPGYEFQEGDVIRESSLNRVRITPITEFQQTIDGDSSGWIVLPDDFEVDADPGGNNVRVEILRIRTAISNDTFESTKRYEITGGTVSNGVRTGISIQGEIGENEILLRGGEFIDPYYSRKDTRFTSRSSGKFIPSVDDTERVVRQNLVHSERFLENTSINGLNVFRFTNVTTIDDTFGEINKLVNLGGVLKVYQESKITSIYIDRTQFFDATGDINVGGQSESFLGSKKYDFSDYGTLHPNSVVKNDRDIYLFDANNGAVLRDSANGVFPISGKFYTPNGSQDYKMDRFFKDVSSEIRSNLSNFEIYLSYDQQNEILWVSINRLSGSKIKQIAFHEPTNRWITFADMYTDSDFPKLFFSDGNDLYSVINDEIWLHNSDESDRCNFYGFQKGFSIDAISTDVPTDIKRFDSIAVHSNTALNNNIEIPISNSYGVMESDISSSEFIIEEGIYKSPYFRNVNTPRFNSRILSKFNGERLRGYSIINNLNISSAPSIIELFKVDINYSISKN